MSQRERFMSVLHKSERIIIGLMSGMSMDGIDIACVKVTGKFPDISTELLGTGYRAYPKDLWAKLLKSRSCTVDEVSRLNFMVAREFAAAVNDFLSESKISKGKIDAIGSHGQTLFHFAASESNAISTSLQVGSPSIIAEHTGLITIGNFRVRDIAAGGEGAPLVAFADYVLNRNLREPVAINNLGSISNVTVITPEFKDVLAFDTGPANLLIDHFARSIAGNTSGLDDSGKISAEGKCDQALLKDWLTLPFFKKAPPKAAGYGDFDPQELTKASAGKSAKDLVRTAVEFSAITLGNAYKDFVLKKFPNLKKVIFSGGGIYNPTLMDAIRRELPGLQIEKMSEEAADSREAVAFAILAHATLNGDSNNVPSVTGATPVVMGEIAI